MKSGQRLRSQTCSGEVIVIRAVDAQHPLEAGGQPLVEPTPDTESPATETEHEGFRLGKRYEHVDGDTRIEVMVTRPGGSALTYAGVPLVNSATKALPTSD